MKLGTIAIAASALALGLVTWITPGNAQGPLWDVVHVNLPYTVTVGDKTLQPGDYKIQQNRDIGGGSRILLIYGDNGMKFETSAMTIPALDPNTARDTKVILHHFGNDYYFDKIWIQGKDYGYEFPVPNSVKAREKEQMAAVTVPADYATASQTTTTETTTASQTTATESTTKAETTESAAATPVVTPEPATPTPTVVESTTAQSTVAESTPVPDTSANSANREMQDSTPAPAPATMPATSAGWLMMLLGGGSLSGIGMALRRKR